MATKTYDAKSIVITVAGVRISGFNDGGMVEVERDEDTWTKQVGTDGEPTRSKSNNRSGTITLMLLQTSLSNDYLSGLAAIDEATNTGVVPVFIKDLLGTTLFAAQAWVQKPANITFEREAGDREWKLQFGEAAAGPQFFVGGSV